MREANLSHKWRRVGGLQAETVLPPAGVCPNYQRKLDLHKWIQGYFNMLILSLTLTSTSEGLRINTAASVPNLIKYTGPYLNENCLVVSVISKKCFF